ncbi:MAG TPA: branched-chain amino acid ABC transporter permease [Solirubrobacteraceae bacterium]|nr:branched-chain amino acid ABC transporter permease [Solirubrobacteraceae bacterium]
MAQIGVDEWVAQSGGRRDPGTGWRKLVNDADARLGWWPRLALVTLVGLIAGQLLNNVNVETVAFNSLLYAMLALGLNIAVGWAGLLDLGYIAFFGLGAYGYAVLSSTATGSGGSGGTHLAAIASVPIVIVIAGVVGVIIGLIALRLSGDYLAIVTLFVGQAFMEIVNNIDPGTLGGVNGIFALDSFHSFGAQITSPTGYYYLALVMTVALAAILHLLDTSRTGRAWRALRDDPLAAAAMTIPVNKLKVMALSFGAVVAALAGTLIAAPQNTVFPTNFTANVLILIYACLVLGGVGSIAGAILGGLVVTIGEQMLSSPNDAGYLFYGLILIALVVRIRPWRHLAAVLAAIVALGFAAHAVVSAISSSAVAGGPGSGGWIGSAVRDYVIVPASPATYGNILYVVLICALVLIVRLHGTRRLLAVIPTVYIAACCWEARLIVNPSITTQIMIGAILIVTMAARPQGLLGTRRVETVDL